MIFWWFNELLGHHIIVVHTVFAWRRIWRVVLGRCVFVLITEQKLNNRSDSDSQRWADIHGPHTQQQTNKQTQKPAVNRKQTQHLKWPIDKYSKLYKQTQFIKCANKANSPI